MKTLFHRKLTILLPILIYLLLSIAAYEMSTSRATKESLPNMVAGKYYEMFGLQDFTETDFDG